MNSSFHISVWLQSKDAKHKWVKLAREYIDVSFSFCPRTESFSEYINALIYNSSHDYVLCCEDSAWIPRDVGARCLDLIDNLESLFGSIGWGVASNSGIVFPSLAPITFIRNRHSNLGKRYRSPIVAACVSGNVLLLNIRALRKSNVNLPLPKNSWSNGAQLTSECYRKGLMCIIDSRLFSIENDYRPVCRSFGKDLSKPLLIRWPTMFLKNSILSILGSVLKGKACENKTLAVERQFAEATDDWINSVKRVLLQSKHAQDNIRLSIIVRTTWKRNFMLKRLLSSLHKSLFIKRTEFPAQFHVEVLIVSDQSHTPDYEMSELLQNDFPDVRVRVLNFPASHKQYPRVHLLLEGIFASDTDFFWIVDDDDIVSPCAITRIFSSIMDRNTLLIGDTEEFEEKDCILDYEQAISAIPSRKYKAEQYVLNVSGLNHVPMCGIIYPSCIKDTLRNAPMVGDYYEDFALSMIALTSKDISVFCLDETICRISKRGPGHNTTEEINRDWWNFNMSTFLAEIVNNADYGPQMMYDLECYHSKIPTWAEFLKKKYSRPLKRLFNRAVLKKNVGHF